VYTGVMCSDRLRSVTIRNFCIKEIVQIAVLPSLQSVKAVHRYGGLDSGFSGGDETAVIC